jgi:hypothetical protein
MPIITHKLEHPDRTPVDRTRPAVARSAERGLSRTGLFRLRSIGCASG